MKDFLEKAKIIIKKNRIKKIPNDLFLLKEEIEKKYPNTREIGNLIRKNPELYSEFIKHCRVIIGDEKIDIHTDVNYLILSIGIDNMFDTFLSAFLTKMFSNNNFGKEVLSYSVDVAIVSSVLTEDLYDVKRTDAYMVALLHCLGSLYIPDNIGTPEEKRIEYFQKSTLSPISSNNIERQRFGTTSRCGSVVLANKWNINKDTIKTIMLLYSTNKDSIITNEHAKKLLKVAKVVEAAKYLVTLSKGENFINKELLLIGKNAIDELNFTNSCYTKSILMLKAFGSTSKNGLVMKK